MSTIQIRLALNLHVFGKVEAVPHSKVLIIEDNPIDREVYKRCLWPSPTSGFEFAEAGSAADGFEMATIWRPDCVLVDVNLPDKDGIEALAQFKAEMGRIPFATVVLTAYSEEAVAVRAMQAGAMDYLPKGKVSMDTLPHVVRNAIAKFRMEQRIEEQRAALEDSARRYQILLEAMPQMVWTASASAQVEYANRRWFDYTGLHSLAEVDRMGWDRLVHPDDREPTWQAWNQATASGSVFEIEHRLRRAQDGSYRWYLVRAVPMRNAVGAITNWFGTCTEIENQKQSEIAQLERQKLESLGRLAGGLAHDFNNLLVAILGGASYAMETLPPSHGVQQSLQGILQAAERAAEITRRMLAYAGKGILRVERAEVDQLVRDAITAAGVPKTIRLEFVRADRLPAVDTDPELLRQAVADLLRNAIEAINEQSTGAIVVRTAVADLGKQNSSRELPPAGLGPGKYVTVEVRDTGCGMDEETQKNIFDPFFTTKFLGRGLGLAAVQGFARSHGGGVRVHSRPGKGTRFQLWLPAAVEKSRGAVSSRS